MNAGSVFTMQLCTPRPGMDILSQWQAGSIERQDGLISPSAPTPGIIWQVNLPRNPYTAQRILQQQRKLQANALQALPHAGQRLQAFTQKITRASEAGDQYTLDLDQVDWPASERALWTWLDAVQPGASYSLTDELKEAGERVSALYQMLVQLGKGDEWIVTDHDGHPLGRSRITWSGDIDTYFVPGASPELYRLHHQHLHTCQEARLAWVRIGLMTTAFAVRLASSLAFPLSWITAARPILRFIRQVFDEYKTLAHTAPHPLE